MVRGDAEGFCDSFEVVVMLNSDESKKINGELIRQARKMCFTEKALTNSTTVTVSYLINGMALEL